MKMKNIDKKIIILAHLKTHYGHQNLFLHHQIVLSKSAKTVCIIFKSIIQKIGF